MIVCSCFRSRRAHLEASECGSGCGGRKVRRRGLFHPEAGSIGGGENPSRRATLGPPPTDGVCQHAREGWAKPIGDPSEVGLRGPCVSSGQKSTARGTPRERFPRGEDPIDAGVYQHCQHRRGSGQSPGVPRAPPRRGRKWRRGALKGEGGFRASVRAWAYCSARPYPVISVSFTAMRSLIEMVPMRVVPSRTGMWRM